MSLPWVRLDSNIATHDKVLALLKSKDGYRAFTLYVCSLGYAGGHGTDGYVPKEALSVLHGTEKHAQMLIDRRLWEYHPEGAGYTIRNYDLRQELEMVTEAKRLGAVKGNCIRWHGKDCGCWKRGGGG
jgi:hypothetical protein